jgi:hypothetical protein
MRSTFKRGDDAKRLAEIATHEEGGLVTFSIPLPYITYPNLRHLKTNWEQMWEAGNTLGFLLNFINWLDPQETNLAGLVLSKKPQLVLINCWSNKNTMGGSPVEAGFSPEAKEIIMANWPKGTIFSEVQRKMIECHEQLSSPIKRVFDKNVSSANYSLYSNCVAAMQEGGVPYFSVPGNCACLGENSDSFKREGGISPHNMDNPLQLLTMFTGVVSLWNEELRPRVK